MARALSGHDSKWGKIDKVDKHRVSFPEFVEWLSTLGVILPVGLSFRNLRAAYDYCSDEDALAPPTSSRASSKSKLLRKRSKQLKKLSEGNMKCFAVVASTVARD